MPLIHIEEASKIYGFGEATTVALNEVDFKVEQGEFVAIMGPSGSGKTTLMNIIGLLDHLTHGKYMINDKPAVRMSHAKRAKMRRDTIGFVFQSFNLVQRLTALENVALPLLYKGYTKTRRLKRAGEILEQIGLGDHDWFLPSQLSGGQIQRVAIARALVHSPKVIIADEPTGNLDSESSRVVMELLRDIHQTGSTVLMVTHNPVLTRYASRIVFMHDGTIVSDEESSVGQIPSSLKRSMFYFKPKKTMEDDLAGVSAVMKAIPAKDKTQKPKKRGRKRKSPRPGGKK